MDLSYISAQQHSEKELGTHPAILTYIYLFMDFEPNNRAKMAQ